jgi:tetratricopeptide (TPR) repeat protein
VYSKGEDILEFKMKEAHNKAAEESKKGDKANNDIIKAHLQTKRMWFDTLMMLYDQRIVYFGDAKKYGKGYIKGKMGQAYYSNYKKEAFDTAYMYMKESVQLEMEEAGHVVILNYFVSGIDMLRAKKITPNDIVEDYLLADKAISKKIADAEAYVAKYPDKKDTPQLRDKAIPSYKEVSDKITETFTKCPCSSCEVLDSIFNSKYEENKANVEWLKKATGLLEKKGCKESSFFEKGAIDLYNIEPSALAAYQIAKLKLKKEQYAEAAKYYEEAINLEVDPLTKSKYLYESAIVARAQDQYSKARTSALKAAELRPNWGEPYLLIAKMYAASAGSCGSDAFEQQGTYWAAVDKAQYAKNIDSSEDVQKEASSLISQYASRYPTKEQGFMREKYEGGSFTVGCWINEATTIRFIK